ncbi:hypothetical protein UFOVP613_45 [uncultured Caudovirales phage]|uniref:Uncharacterized protein n=1 Tax=uncultured Caudovirales phage TaxID=2100421 RepID=A0A6J5NBX7_9CAUD|nr:hypothetical protein UFOVP613_45 [uncultured Caudovirales phage]
MAQQVSPAAEQRYRVESSQVELLCRLMFPNLPAAGRAEQLAARLAGVGVSASTRAVLAWIYGERQPRPAYSAALRMVADQEGIRLRAGEVERIGNPEEPPVYPPGDPMSAIVAMCVSCAGADRYRDARCWDSTCPLRPFSPLPLMQSEEKEEDDDHA